MVSIQGIGGVPDPKPERASKPRAERDDVRANAGAGKGKDGVTISSEAQAAAEVSRIVQLSNVQDDVRLEKIEQARERLARGDYKNPEVVSQLAERLLKYL